MRRFVATAVKRASPRPMHGVPLPRPVRAGGGAQSRPIRAGRCPVERAPLAAQHCPAHGYSPQADCQTNKKKRRSPRRPCCRGARPKPSASGGKCSGSMSSGALWAPKDEKCGAGWSSNAPGGALGAGQPGRSPVAQAVVVVTGALPPTLLVFRRSVESLRQGPAAPAAPARPQRRGADPHRRGH